MTCPHDKVSNDGFGKYHYCLRCGKRVHMIMKGQFEVSRFHECLDNCDDKDNGLFYEGEKDCNCENLIQLNPNEVRVT